MKIHMVTRWNASLPYFLLYHFKWEFHATAVSEEFGAYPRLGRKTPAGGAHIFPGQTNIFFLTVNAKDRVPWIAQPDVQSSLEDIWRNEAAAWRIGYYLLMPDHLHLFCAPYDLNFDIDGWITFWKRQFSRRHLGQSWEWQRRGVHHRMRNRIQYEEKLLYVRENPLRKNLVMSLDDWRFQGRIYDVSWIGD
jgi:putative transposase